MARTRKRASAWDTHVRNVRRATGASPARAMKLASKSYNKSTGRPKSNWKSLVRSGAKKGSSRKSGSYRRSGSSRKGRRGGRGRNLDSFSGLENYLAKLLGYAKSAVRSLRPSESLAARKEKLEKLIGDMGKGISALKEREQIEDMNRAQYNAHVAELKKMKQAYRDLVKAWNEAHRKQRSSSEPWTGPPNFGGFMASGDFDGDVEGDRDGRGRFKRKAKRKSPKRRAKKKSYSRRSTSYRRRPKSGSARKRTSGKRRVSAATRKKMSAAAKRRWAKVRSKKRGGKRRSPKRASAKRRGSKRKRSRRDADYGGFDSF
jgi:hypothetical protein